MIRWAVYRVDLGKAPGHEQRGRRLGLVISPSESPLSVVTIVPTSTSARPAIHRPELEVAVGDPVDYLSHEQMAEVELALAHYLGIHGVTIRRA